MESRLSSSTNRDILTTTILMPVATMSDRMAQLEATSAIVRTGATFSLEMPLPVDSA